MSDKKGAIKGFFAEFKEFALKGNMIDLAVGVLIGTAFSGLVTSLTSNLIQPLIDCIGTVDGSGFIVKVGSQSLKFGAFLSDVINFIIMAFIIFLIVRAINRIKNFGKKKEEPAPVTVKVCPFCKSEISIEATRCPHCTSELPEEEKGE